MNTFIEAFIFELKYWKKRPIVYIFPILIFLLSLLMMTMDGISVGGGDLVYKNSPYTLTTIYFAFFLMSPLFINAVVSSSITRDYEYKMNQLTETLPVKRWQILISRFLGGCLVMSFMYFGVLLADIVGHFVPWLDEHQLGKIHWQAHLKIYWTMALPNIIIIGSILFLIATLSKKVNISFIGAIVLVIVYMTLINLSDKIDNDDLLSLFDPFGYIPIELQAKKWTPFEKNNILFDFDNRLILNRLFWFGVSILMWVIAIKIRPDFSLKFFKKKRNPKKSLDYTPSVINLTKDFSLYSKLKSSFYQGKIEFKSILYSPMFFTVNGLILFVFIMQIVGMILDDSVNRIATTDNTILFLSAVTHLLNFSIILFAGIMIWKERDAKYDEIVNSAPTNTFILYFGKILGLLFLAVVCYLIIMMIGILYQIFNGVYHIELGLYFKYLFGINLYKLMALGIISMFFQILIPNKFVAYFVSLIVLFFEGLLWSQLKISTNMIGIKPQFPNYNYSDFYGFSPYTKHLVAFMIYWALIYGIIVLISMAFYVRDNDNGYRRRTQKALSFFKQNKTTTIVSLLLTVVFGGWLYYQTQMKNPYFHRKEQLKRTALYEQKFKKYENEPSPRVFHADYEIDLYPKERKYLVKGKLKLVNKNTTPLKSIMLHYNYFHPHTTTLSIPAILTSDSSTRMIVERYEFENPVMPYDSFEIDYTYSEEYTGVENNVSNNRLVSNGTFIDNSDFTPQIGYSRDFEMSDKSDREEYGLPLKQDNMPELEKNCTQNCMLDYLKFIPSDWATVHTIISTSDDQMAIVPGDLIEKKTENGRNIFEYNLSQPSKFFFSLVSADFKVKKDTVSGVSCEVYYHPTHEYNTDEMMKALKHSIKNYSELYSPYRHHQARIIEFPKFSYFAQAFPGTMPYSEGIGFTSNLAENPDDINEIYHIVSHEMAHQWWAHQLVGAYMQGATLLSESMSEFSSLYLMTQEYGIDMASKFLKDANQSYLWGRSKESRKESSLLKVDNQQYIHYQKGSLVLYGLYQLLGDAPFFKVLKDLMQSYAYQEPPYPTSYALYDQLNATCPDSLKSYLDEGLKGIIVFKTDISEVKSEKKGEQFETTVSFTINKLKSDPEAKVEEDLNDILIGKNEEVPLNDYFDIGLFEKGGEKLRYGNNILLKRYKITQNDNTLTLISKTKPDKVVIDPYFLHIYKAPEDNIEKVK